MSHSVVWAGMDIGTNSVKILVAKVGLEARDATVEVLRHNVHVTRMGEGLNASGRLGDVPMARALEAIRTLAAEAATYAPAGISALGMEAFRRAENGPEFADRITRETGIPVRILKGPEEASLGREGVLAGFGEPLPETVLVMDTGGGSSELALTSPSWEVSVPRGAVTTTEAYLKSDPPTAEEMATMRTEVRAAIADAWRQCPAAESRPPIIAVGGTVTSFGSMHVKMATWDPTRVHRLHLTTADIVAQTDRLAAMTLEQRRQVVGLDPARAPVIVGGGALLEAVLLAVGQEGLRISLANLLHAHVIHEARRWNVDHAPQHA